MDLRWEEDEQKDASFFFHNILHISAIAQSNNSSNNNNSTEPYNIFSHAANLYRSEYDFIGAGFGRRRRVVKVEENRGFLVLRFDIVEDGRTAGSEGVTADTPTAGRR